MNVPKTYFSTELHTGRRVLRHRLEDLFAAPAGGASSPWCAPCCW